MMSLLIIFGFFGFAKAGENGLAQLIAALAKTLSTAYDVSGRQSGERLADCGSLKKIYSLEKTSPCFYKMREFQEDSDYYIAALIDHIKVLENKIISGNKGFASWSMLKGIGCSAISALSGCAAYFLYHATSSIHATKYDSYDAFLKEQEIMDRCVGIGFVSATSAVVAFYQFYKVYHYMDRLVERLTRDRRLLANFQNEKVHLSKKSD